MNVGEKEWGEGSREKYDKNEMRRGRMGFTRHKAHEQGGLGSGRIGCPLESFTIVF